MKAQNDFPLVPLNEVILQDQDYILELDPQSYKKLSVKLYGRGVVLDTPIDGAKVRMKRHQLAKAGQIILSEIWAKKGAQELESKMEALQQYQGKAQQELDALLPSILDKAFKGEL